MTATTERRPGRMSGSAAFLGALPLFVLALAAVAGGAMAERHAEVRAILAGLGVEPGLLGSATYFGFASKVGGALALVGLMRLALRPRILPEGAGEGGDEDEGGAPLQAAAPAAAEPPAPMTARPKTSDWQRRLAERTARSSAPYVPEPRLRRMGGGTGRKVLIALLLALIGLIVASMFGAPAGQEAGPAEAAPEAVASATAGAADAAADAAAEAVTIAGGATEAVLLSARGLWEELDIALPPAEPAAFRDWAVATAQAAMAGDMAATRTLAVLAGGAAAVLVLLRLLLALLRALRPRRLRRG